MTNNFEYLEQKAKTVKMLRNIMTTCIEDMHNVGIPVQDNRITGIGIKELKGTRAACVFTLGNDSLLNFYILIHEKIIKHLDDEKVIANVKNSIYHELLHTCENCQEHNDVWMKWSKICDDKLGTHTRRHLEEKLYYNPSLAPIIYRCPDCGNEYWAVKELLGDCECELCGGEMK